ncbi:hypothetical protein BD626DRAFT_510217 [Schizophyllum amplum]|uniref:Secreted protein n=1 Tax=Schizophyllum amplum TaxID=97359 RepID=A0A550C2C6_9AGAR|nr:hypothetical protein BD626DRAFT_510217 [Auriculariopsis ampla]
MGLRCSDCWILGLAILAASHSSLRGSFLIDHEDAYSTAHCPRTTCIWPHAGMARSPAHLHCRIVFFRQLSIFMRRCLKTAAAYIRFIRLNFARHGLRWPRETACRARTEAAPYLEPCISKYLGPLLAAQAKDYT